MVALDTYQDNLCLWRCIAVHRGARPDGSTKVARGLAKSFFKLKTMPTNCPKTSLDELDKVAIHLNQRSAFSEWLGIRVYEPERGKDAEVVWHLRRNPAAQLKNILTIGVFEGHAFVIKDIARLAKTYACAHYNARFTQAGSLQRHVQRCAQGKTVIDCPGEKVEAPQTAFEKAFYPNHRASKESLRWLDQEAKRWKIHIHHAMCGHGGERWVERAPVDGYNPETRQYFNTTAATGTDVENVTHMIVTESFTATTKRAKTFSKPQRNAQVFSERPVTAWLRLGHAKLGKSLMSYREPKQKATRTRSCTILRRTVTIISGRSRRPLSRWRTRTC